MLISQIKLPNGEMVVVAREETGAARIVNHAPSLYHLAVKAANEKKTLHDIIAAQGLGQEVDIAEAYAQGRMMLPITHPDPAHMHLTGTGLTHLGSASTRDSMHQEALEKPESTLTDTMKMFRMGLEGGKPQSGVRGVQPEWFYKGNGLAAVAPGQSLISPSFALDGGEEPELAGIYIIADDGSPCRIGFAIANEFSDHVTEKINYLYLAHSKLRTASFGPELRIGKAPDDIRGHSRILRDGQPLWEKPFLSGEANMSHSLDNLEYHHFKYDLFCSPGDVHVHMFGTATLSFADGISAQAGDIFEIEAPDFGLALRNPLQIADDRDVVIRQL